jgi:hypothetical protein
MAVISYLLFVFTLIIFIRTRKKQVEKTMKRNKKKSSKCKNIHEKKKSEHTRKIVMTKIGMYSRKEKKIRTYSGPSEKHPNERKATHTWNK